MNDGQDPLGSNLGDAPAPPAPPPPPEAVGPAPAYIMAPGEQFSFEQYLEAGWTVEQLLQTGKATRAEFAGPGIELVAPLGMPEATWIILDDNDDIPPTGLFVGHNGTGYLIQTGVPVLVPNAVIGVLDLAVMSAPIINPADRKVMGYRDRPRYTYRRVSAPVEA